MNLLAAFALLLQDRTAEETFKKIEETIKNAKTLSATVKLTYWVRQEGKQSEPHEGVVTLLMKQGNKMHFTKKCPPRNDYRVVSDGSKVSLKPENARVREREVPETLNEGLALMLARACSAYELFVDRLKYPRDHERGKWPDARATLQPSDFGQGQDDKDSKTLTYKLKLTNASLKEVTAECRLWYDPKSLRPLKRSLTGKTEQGDETLTETFESFVLDADIPDEKFKLPAEK